MRSISSRIVRVAAAVLVTAISVDLSPGRAVEPDPVRDGRPRPEHEFVPLSVRDLTLPAALLLGFDPSSAVEVPRGRVTLDLDVSHANNFQASGNVERYLEERGGPRRPLSPEDARAILDLPGDAFYLDGEFVSTRLTVRVGLGSRTHVTGSVPYFLFTGGGYLDGLVYDFHDALGLGQAGRQYVRDNRFQAIFDLDGDPTNGVVLLEPPTSGGWGDPTIQVHHRLPGSAAGWRFAVQAAYKFAVADEDVFLSSGSDDWGVQWIAERIWNRWGLIANANWVAAGGFAVLPEFDNADPFGAAVAVVRETSPSGRLLFQLLAGESVFRDATGSALAEIQLQASIGMRWRRPRHAFGFAVTENIANFDNTPDIAMHVFVGVRLR